MSEITPGDLIRSSWLDDELTPAPEGEPLFVSETCEGETCWCGKPAVRKVGEEFADDEPNPARHNLTRYICAHHFAELMGPAGARSVGIAPVFPAPEGEVVKTMCLTLTEAEMVALEGVMASKDLSAPAVFRNSFRLYQLVDRGLASIIHHDSGPNGTGE